jgi:hypothetical protein
MAFVTLVSRRTPFLDSRRDAGEMMVFEGNSPCYLANGVQWVSGKLAPHENLKK